jgi:serine protease Do
MTLAGGTASELRTVRNGRGMDMARVDGGKGWWKSPGVWRSSVAVALFVLVGPPGLPGFATGTAMARQSPDNPVPQISLPNFSMLVKRCGPSVVNISVVREVTQMGVALPPGMEPGNPLAPFFARRVIGNREEVSLGSGFIVTPDGYILTNRHVVADAQSVVVKLTDKREFKGKVIGSDALSDVALVKIDADNLRVVETGDPDQVDVGDWVMAIGSPYGFSNTVTSGIVSAKSRSLPGESYIPFIQTDVPINPGNSGGPLFDLQGRVIAINSTIYSRTGGYQGLSFAIPIDIALDVKDQLLKTGHVVRGRLGVAVQEVSQSLARSFGLSKPDGALVSLVEAGGVAAQAGIRPGDVILAVNGTQLGDSADLLTTVARLKPGSTADLLVWRAGGAVHVDVKVGVLMVAAAEGSVADPQTAGIVARVLTPAERNSAHVDHGLLVEEVANPASSAGLKPGDIVLAVDQVPVSTLEQFADQLKRTGTKAALLVQRGGATLYVPIHDD